MLFTLDGAKSAPVKIWNKTITATRIKSIVLSLSSFLTSKDAAFTVFSAIQISFYFPELMMQVMIFSCVASAAGISPTILPSFMM